MCVYVHVCVCVSVCGLLDYSRDVAALDIREGHCIAWDLLASFPGLRGGEGRPGMHCARMRVIIAKFTKRTVGVYSKRHN